MQSLSRNKLGSLQLQFTQEKNNQESASNSRRNFYRKKLPQKKKKEKKLDNNEGKRKLREIVTNELCFSKQ